MDDTMKEYIFDNDTTLLQALSSLQVTDLVNIKSLTDANTQAIVDLTTQLNSLGQTVFNNNATANAQFATINTSLLEITDEVNSLSTMVTSLSSEVNTLSDQFSAISTDFQVLSMQVENLSDEVDSFTSALSALNNSVSIINNQIEVINANLESTTNKAENWTLTNRRRLILQPGIEYHYRENSEFNPYLGYFKLSDTIPANVLSYETSYAGVISTSANPAGILANLTFKGAAPWQFATGVVCLYQGIGIEVIPNSGASFNLSPVVIWKKIS